MTVNLPTPETADMLNQQLAGMPLSEQGTTCVSCLHLPTGSLLVYSKSLLAGERLLTLTLQGGLHQIGVINNWLLRFFSTNCIFAVCDKGSFSFHLTVKSDWRTGVPCRARYRGAVTPMYFPEHEYPWWPDDLARPEDADVEIEAVA